MSIRVHTRRRTIGRATGLFLCAMGGAGAAESGAALRHPGDRDLLVLHGVGAQIYGCKAAADGAPMWTFQAPQADLLANGVRVGQHGAGPFWAYQDGSRVTGKVEDKANGAGPGDIPWLRLAVISHEGEGAFSRVTAVIRSNTKGGVLAGPCEQPGALRNVPYEADYTFIAQG